MTADRSGGNSGKRPARRGAAPSRKREALGRDAEATRAAFVRIPVREYAGGAARSRKTPPHGLLLMFGDGAQGGNAHNGRV